MRICDSSHEEYERLVKIGSYELDKHEQCYR